MYLILKSHVTVAKQEGGVGGGGVAGLSALFAD